MAIATTTITAIAAIATAAAATAGTAYTLSKGSGVAEPPAPVTAPPPPPEAPAPPPAAPSEGDAEAGIAADRRKRMQRFGVRDTLLTSPLGGGSDLAGGRPQGRSLLGGS